MFIVVTLVMGGLSVYKLQVLVCGDNEVLITFSHM